MEAFDEQVRAQMQNLLAGEPIIYDLPPMEEVSGPTAYTDSEAFEHLKYECIGGRPLKDEKTYCEEPFEDLAIEMQNVTEDGKIKKKIIREGFGNKPTEGQQVTIDYNAYIEMQDVPFDSTYLNKKPKEFFVNSGDALIGLDLGVQTMKVDEKAQFLVHYDYAYGEMGCLERIPPKQTILFEVELKKIVNYEGMTSFKKLSEEEQRKFVNAYKYAQSLCLKAKEQFKKNLRGAVKDYNIAANKMEYCVMDTYEEQEKQQALLLRIYTNLVVCHSKLSEPKKTCIFCNKIQHLVRNTNLQVPCKVYFNNAKSFRQLQEYDLALERLKKAQAMEPHNGEIIEEFMILEKEMKEYKERENQLAKAMMQGKKKDVGITEDFKDATRKICKDFLKSHNKRLEIKEILSDIEAKYWKEEAERAGLKFEKITKGNTVEYFVEKRL